METTGFFVFHEGSPHLVLDGFPKDFLEPKVTSQSVDPENQPVPVLPVLQGQWPVETMDGLVQREGFLLPLQGRLGDNGKREARLLCEGLKLESLARGMHKVRFDAEGGLLGWSRSARTS